MCAFAHQDEDDPDCVRRHSRLQPQQKRNDEARRVLRRHEIGRADEDHTEPNRQRQPIFEEKFHPEVKRLKSEISTERGTSNIPH